MKLLLSLLLLLMWNVTTQATDASTIKDMPFVVSSKYCLECHSVRESTGFENSTTKSCSVYCSTCHQDLGAHHTTDLFLTGPVHPGIELLNRKIACFTCHDLTKKRSDSTSWKAESLFESMFQKQDIYPTYFLIEKNNDGQLCKKCH